MLGIGIYEHSKTDTSHSVIIIRFYHYLESTTRVVNHLCDITLLRPFRWPCLLTSLQLTRWNSQTITKHPGYYRKCMQGCQASMLAMLWMLLSRYAECYLAEPVINLLLISLDQSWHKTLGTSYVYYLSALTSQKTVTIVCDHCIRSPPVLSPLIHKNKYDGITREIQARQNSHSEFGGRSEGTCSWKHVGKTTCCLLSQTAAAASASISAFNHHDSRYLAAPLPFPTLS